MVSWDGSWMRIEGMTASMTAMRTFHWVSLRHSTASSVTSRGTGPERGAVSVVVAIVKVLVFVQACGVWPPKNPVKSVDCVQVEAAGQVAGKTATGYVRVPRKYQLQGVGASGTVRRCKATMQGDLRILHSNHQPFRRRSRRPAPENLGSGVGAQRAKAGIAWISEAVRGLSM